VGSIVPTYGDLPTNGITQLTNVNRHDFIWLYDPKLGYEGPDQVVLPGNGSGYNNEWTLGDPTTTNVAQGFFYHNNQASTNNWVENFTVSP